MSASVYTLHQYMQFAYNTTMAIDVYYVYGVSQCIIQSLTIIANLLTIIAFLKVPNLLMHTSNILIYALSVADLFWGVYRFVWNDIPFIFSLGPPGGEIGCMITVPLEYVYSAGNLILIVISVDRVMFVTMDYSKYMKMVTKLRLKITIGLCFLITIVAALFEISLWNYAKRNNLVAANIDFTKNCLYPPRRMKWMSLFVSVTFYILPLLLVAIFSIVFINRLLVRISKKRRQVGIAPSVHSVTNNSNADAGESSNANEGNKRYMKAAITLAALVASMGICMLPYCVYLLVGAFSGRSHLNVTYVMLLILQLNPLLDPVFYAATQKHLREFYRAKMIGLFRKCRNP